MPIHDAYARITPYEILLPQEDFADECFPAILDEAEQRKTDLTDLGGFVMLDQTGSVLREIRGEDDPPELLRQHGALLYHAFHFWRQERPFLQLETGVLRFLVETGPQPGEWAPSLPGPAGYAQLPQHLFWVPGGEDSPPESLDGFFWSAPDGESLSILIAMGMRKDRPGLSVVPLPSLPVSAAGEWAGMEVRPQGKDFQSSLPGAEVEGLYSIEAGAEAVKLAMRVFWYLDSFPGCVAPGVPGAETKEGPRPSALDYRKIVLDPGSP